MRGKVIGLAIAAAMIGAGGFWTAGGLGWIGDSESSSLAVAGPLVAGLGVALAIVILQGRRE